jgi:hypothetical protein
VMAGFSDADYEKVGHHTRFMLNENLVAILGENLHPGWGKTHAVLKGSTFFWNSNIHNVPPHKNPKGPEDL